MRPVWRQVAVVASGTACVGVPLGLVLGAAQIARQQWVGDAMWHLAAQALAGSLVTWTVATAGALGALGLFLRVASGRAGLGSAAVATALAAVPIFTTAPLLRPAAVLWTYQEDAGFLAFLARAQLETAWTAVVLFATALLVAWVLPRLPRSAVDRWDAALLWPRTSLGLGGLAVVWVAAVTIEGFARVPRGPDVVVVVLDTVRQDHLGMYGHERPTDPVLAAFARDAVRYDGAIAPAPWTTPSIAAALTGLHPHRFGFLSRPVRVPDATLFITEGLRDRGWATFGVISNLYGSRAVGFHQGFDTFDEDNALGEGHISSASVTDKALDWLAGVGKRPMFLYVHYYDPHSAFVDHAHIDWADPEYSGPVESPAAIHVLRDLAPDLEEADREQVRAYYDEEIRHTDHHLGRVLDALRERGRYDDALIIVFSDHGEGFAERPDRWFGHTRHLHDELLRVPLLVKWPQNRNGGTRVATPVSLVDIAPTVASVVGLPWDGDGQALGQQPVLRPIVSTCISGDDEPLKSVVLGDLKLIRNDASRATALYDLSVDPGEERDLSTERPDDVARLEAALDARLAALPARGAAREASFSDDEVEMLKGLGYLEEGPQ